MISVLAHPPVGEGGATTVTDEEDTDTSVPGLASAKSTSVTPPRCLPVMVTTVPPDAGPDEAEAPVAAGQASGGDCRAVTTDGALGVPRPEARS